MRAAQPLLNKIQRHLRVLTKDPGLTASAVIMLALGIGASAAIFSFQCAVAIRHCLMNTPSSSWCAGAPNPSFRHCRFPALTFSTGRSRVICSPRWVPHPAFGPSAPSA